MASPRRRLSQYLPVLELGDDCCFDAGPDPAVHPVVVVADELAGVVAPRGGDRSDARYPPHRARYGPSSNSTTVCRATMTSLRYLASSGR